MIGPTQAAARGLVLVHSPMPRVVPWRDVLRWEWPPRDAGGHYAHGQPVRTWLYLRDADGAALGILEDPVEVAQRYTLARGGQLDHPDVIDWLAKIAASRDGVSPARRRRRVRGGA